MGAIIVGTYEMQEAAKMNAKKGGEGGRMLLFCFSLIFPRLLSVSITSFPSVLTTIVTVHFIPVLG